MERDRTLLVTRFLGFTIRRETKQCVSVCFGLLLQLHRLGVYPSYADNFVRKVHFVWAKRFASKTFVTLLNVKWPFSTRNQTKCTKHFVCVRFIECKVWPQINVCLSVVKGQVERAEFAGWFIIATCKVRALCRETASTL